MHAINKSQIMIFNPFEAISYIDSHFGSLRYTCSIT